MEVEHNDHDDSDKGDREYATLACQWPGAIGATTVHLEATFYDRQQTTVLRVNAVIVGNGAMTDSSGVYEGCVLREQAAATSCRRVKSDAEGDGEAENVRVWLRDARAALFGRGSDATVAEYVHSLQLLCSGNDPEPSGPLLQLSWKMKLHPIGMMVLGSVQLFRVPEQSQVSLALVSSKFIEPLIKCLLEERKRHQQDSCKAAADAKQLLEDNHRLLDRLRSAADSRQQDDKKLLAQFVEVLNAKKRRLIAIQQELSELKQQQKCTESIAVNDNKAQKVTVQQRGRGRGRGRKAKLNTTVYDKQFNDVPVVMKKSRPRTMQASNNKWCSILSEEEEQKVDDVDTVLQNNEGKKLHRLDENMEIDDKNITHINVDHGTSDVIHLKMGSPSAVDVFDADTQIDYPDNDDKQPPQLELFETNHKSSLAVSNINDLNPCVIDLKTAADSPKVDTLSDGPINNITPDNSPPWLEQQTTDTEMLLQKSPNKDIGCQQPKKDVLEDLWSGIL